MPQPPRPLDPTASPEAFLGARIRALRLAQGWSQAELGQKVHASGALIGKVEKAERRPGLATLKALDDVLAAGGELLRAASVLDRLRPSLVRQSAGSDPGFWVAGVDRFRRLADVYDCPPDGPVRELPELRASVAAVVHRRLASDYSALLAVLPDLISEVTRALLLNEGAGREELAGLLVQLWRAADAVVDKVGLYDLSARLIHVMGWAAGFTGSQLVHAATRYVRAETFFASGQLAAGREMLERAAGELTPGSSPAATAQFGALHMRAAVISARAGLADHAADHLAEALVAARDLPERAWHGTSFGPVSVRIHEVSAAVELNAPDAALAAAGVWRPPENLPAERRSHFYVDLARAHLALGHGDDVIQALRTAEEIAPEHVRVHPHVRQILVEVAALSARHASAARNFVAGRAQLVEPVD